MRVFQLALLAAAALLATASASVPPTEVSKVTVPETPTWNRAFASEDNTKRSLRTDKLSQATLVKQYYSERNEFADWFLKGKGHPYMYGELGMAKEGVGSKAYLKLMRYVDYFEQYKAIAMKIRFHV
ncbi:hypothetical protein PHYSODRAFT_308016 [Phytophthora sojae]|uniref:RxLR effector protein n=1 Tax=Phytophthora sojae (strain P6497) TaxID=1094619 RepID=G5AHQ4_PHYSP|nr:hypothetical protein PHYSODRAFT_308016 [Phytophthora sojae]EGZ04975.1 hypothetical protein PHYSODRAFT_308016 [Phytophthora sojae]|eukprot:XP_009539605.1 hypothetical protein PHYSODRAFT_308016 [Phytophthora sojae]